MIQSNPPPISTIPTELLHTILKRVYDESVRNAETVASIRERGRAFCAYACVCKAFAGVVETIIIPHASKLASTSEHFILSTIIPKFWFLVVRVSGNGDVEMVAEKFAKLYEKLYAESRETHIAATFLAVCLRLKDYVQPGSTVMCKSSYFAKETMILYRGSGDGDDDTRTKIAFGTGRSVIKPSAITQSYNEVPTLQNVFADATEFAPLIIVFGTELSALAPDAYNHIQLQTNDILWVGEDGGIRVFSEKGGERRFIRNVDEYPMGEQKKIGKRFWMDSTNSWLKNIHQIRARSQECAVAAQGGVMTGTNAIRFSMFGPRTRPFPYKAIKEWRNKDYGANLRQGKLLLHVQEMINLQFLDLSSHTTETTLTNLFERIKFQSLIYLDLSGASFSDKTLRAITQGCEGVEKLILRYSTVEADWLEAAAKMQKLKEIDLTLCDFDGMYAKRARFQMVSLVS
ncbi:hypothetical protein HK097_006704 [Rhizophlyctis rosea]|uniref:Uncharacterized protein n=1 Tax=Rhizophlyctis rosea TaxID=64517 RepID=A0AAD5SFH5_9FUNG|nr:hypothetical protein HK097_006704 [Rhizophlyctis rosea]